METRNAKSLEIGWAAMMIATSFFALVAAWVLLANGPDSMVRSAMGQGPAWPILLATAAVTVVVISVVLILGALTHESR